MPRDYRRILESARELSDLALERKNTLDALNTKRDEAVLTAYNAGLTLKEIALYLNVSVPTVQRALGRKRT